MYTEEDKIIVDEFTENGTRTIYKFAKGNVDFIKSTSLQEEFFSNMLDELKIDLVHFHHLMFMPLEFFNIAKEKGLKTIINCSDFYFVCPTANLLENNDFRKFCNACEDLDKCDKCLTKRGYRSQLQNDWRKTCKNIFNKTDMIISPANIVAEIYRRVYGFDEKKIKIIGNGYTPKSDIIRGPEFDPKILRVGFAGEVMVPHKGQNLILDILKSNKNNKIEWHFFGKSSDPTSFLKTNGIEPVSKIVSHGLYQKEELPTLLGQAGIHLVIIPSLETFSNVLSEVWSAHIPVVAPDVLALGERIRKHGAGWMYEYPGSSHVILELLEKIFNNPNDYAEKLSKLQNIKIKSNVECSNEYANAYKEILN